MCSAVPVLCPSLLPADVFECLQCAPLSRSLLFQRLVDSTEVALALSKYTGVDLKSRSELNFFFFALYSEIEEGMEGQLLQTLYDLFFIFF